MSKSSNAMNAKKFRDYQPHQLMILPPALDEWLPEDHPVHFISQVVDQLDLSAIYSDYTERRGQPPYEPRMMVKVWLYAYMRGIRSSRRLERALYEDMGFRVLSANQQPDHWTLSNFRRRHHEALARLFVQSVRLAQEAGLVKLRHVAVDGTKLKAYASKHSAMSYGRMKEEERRLTEEIRRYLEEVEANDRAEDDEHGSDSGWRLPPELATAEKRLQAIREAKARLEQRARAEAEAKEAAREAEAAKKGRRARRKQAPSDPLPADKDQINFTDPESRILRSADKAFIQGYNAQLAVDAETHLIVAADLTNQAADTPHLPSQLQQVEANTGRYPRELSADAGYYSKANLQALEERGVEAFIPPEKIRHTAWRKLQPPRGRMPKPMTTRDRMRRKLRTVRGRERYKLRQCSVEPVIGHLKEAMGLRQLLLRGLSKARFEWLFTCTAFNLMKLWRHWRQGLRGSKEAMATV